MKYQLNDGRIMSDKELKSLFFSVNPIHNKDVEFWFWLYFSIERGVIKRVEDER